MTIWTILALAGAGFLFLFGLWATFQPNVVADAIETDLDSHRSRAEFRVTFGGIFSGMGLAALLLRSPEAFLVLGFASFAGAIVRIVSIWLDKPAVNASYLGFLASEIVTGVILVLPWILRGS